MTQHVNRRSSAFIALVTLIVLIVGAFFIAKAMESKGVEVKVEKTKVENPTWKFIGDEEDSPTNADYYELDTEEAPCLGRDETVCKIEAPADPSNPNRPNMNADVVVSPTLTQKVHQRISSSLNASPIATNETVTALREF